MLLRQFLVLLLLACCSATCCQAQRGYLYLKKHNKRIRIYTEGDLIRVQIAHQGVLTGQIVGLRNDSVFIKDYGYHISDITSLVVGDKEREPFPVTIPQLGLITGGVALATVGMTASNWETFDHALIYSATIGYGPLLVSYGIRKLKPKRTAFPIGKKFRLQVLDFYLVPRRS